MTAAVLLIVFRESSDIRWAGMVALPLATAMVAIHLFGADVLVRWRAHGRLVLADAALFGLALAAVGNLSAAPFIGLMLVVLVAVNVADRTKVWLSTGLLVALAMGLSQAGVAGFEATLDKSIQSPAGLVVQGLLILGAAQEGIIQELRKTDRALDRDDIARPATELHRKAAADFHARRDLQQAVLDRIDEIREEVQFAVHNLSESDSLYLENMFNVKKIFRMIREDIFAAAK